MKVTREGMKHAYKRAKHLAGATWSNAKWGFEQADRVATLTGKGLLALGDRLDPEVSQTAGRALQRYGQTSRRFHTVDHNLERVGEAIRDVGFDL